MSSPARSFTGRTILFWLLLFFGTVAAVNGVMIWLALNSTPSPAHQEKTLRPTTDSQSVDPAFGSERNSTWPT
jgi:hypothetical protein